MLYLESHNQKLRFINFGDFAIFIHAYSTNSRYSPIPPYVIQYNLFGDKIKPRTILPIKKTNPILSPHSRTAIPIQNEAAARKNKVFHSKMEPRTIMIIQRESNKPKKAIRFAPNNMR